MYENMAKTIDHTLSCSNVQIELAGQIGVQGTPSSLATRASSEDVFYDAMDDDFIQVHFLGAELLYKSVCPYLRMSCEIRCENHATFLLH